ncbi:CopG family transcriptional regulator/antitoxin (plasmid) [Candidatus Megaera polyxenophila]|nr:CopG family transcriptional regulator/antitoxin [Candidatus Megaera polyxenophila]
MISTRKNNFEVQIFTRITKDMDALLDKVVEEQERSKSFILRKALEQYLQVNVVN